MRASAVAWTSSTSLDWSKSTKDCTLWPPSMVPRSCTALRGERSHSKCIKKRLHPQVAVLVAHMNSAVYPAFSGNARIPRTALFSTCLRYDSSICPTLISLRSISINSALATHLNSHIGNGVNNIPQSNAGLQFSLEADKHRFGHI